MADERTVARAPGPTVIPARDLTGSHVGLTVRFRTWRNDLQVAVVVTGPLFSANHTSRNAVVGLGPQGASTYILDRGQPVIVGPRADYTDCVVLDTGSTADREIQRDLYASRYASSQPMEED